MAIEVVVPRLGWSMDEGIFTEWLKKDGELVVEGDSLFVLEGEKASQDIESLDRGILRIPATAPQPGDTVLVGQLLAYLCREDEEIPTDEDGTDSVIVANANQSSSSVSSPAHRRDDENDGNGNPVASPSVRRLAREKQVDLASVTGSGKSGRITRGDVEDVANTSTTSAPPARDSQRLRISPRAARTAAELGVDAKAIQGTGKGGRIRERDVLAAASSQGQAVTTSPIADTLRDNNASATGAGKPMSTDVDFLASSDDSTSAAPAGLSARTLPISKLRETIAHRMLAGVQQAAPVTLTTTLNATQLVAVRQQLCEIAVKSEEPAPTFTSLLIRLTCSALAQHEIMTAQWTIDGITIPKCMDIAVAVDTESGLYAPVLVGASTMHIREIDQRLRDLANRTRQQTLRPAEMKGGCFTITNLGRYGVDAFTPILNLPQSAILGVGRIAKQPMIVNNQVVACEAVTLSLTFDHRVTDGAPAAAFLDTLRRSIEELSTWSLM